MTIRWVSTVTLMPTGPPSAAPALAWEGMVTRRAMQFVIGMLV